MKITTIEPEDYYEGVFEVILQTNEGEKSLSFGSGEPEDMNLARDLSDALSIPNLLIMAYNAGKNNEELIIETK